MHLTLFYVLTQSHVELLRYRAIYVLIDLNLITFETDTCYSQSIAKLRRKIGWTSLNFLFGTSTLQLYLMRETIYCTRNRNLIFPTKRKEEKYFPSSTKTKFWTRGIEIVRCLYKKNTDKNSSKAVLKVAKYQTFLGIKWCPHLDVSRDTMTRRCE